MICPQTQVHCPHDCGGAERELCASPQASSPKPPPTEVGDFNLFTSPPPPTLAELVSMREDGSLVIDPSVTSFSAQPSSDGWTMEQVSLSNGDIVECGPLVGKTLVDVPGDAAPFVMRDLTRPTLAEIERLVDAFVRKVVYFERDPMQYKRDEMNEARAALMAAIRAYGRE